MTNTLCDRPVNPRKGGRVAFRNMSVWAWDWTGVEGDRRPAHCDGKAQCADHSRQNGKGNDDARLRVEYAAGSRPTCALCGEQGSFALGKYDAARLVISHTIAVVLFGSHSVINLHASHNACNAAAGDRDLRSLVPAVTEDLPTLAQAQRWARTPHRLWVPENVPTVEDMAAGRAARWNEDGSQGCGF